jgi:integrin-linked kinase-associated serine/threonine phosphatase 2C
VNQVEEEINEDNIKMQIFGSNIIGKKKKSEMANQDTYDIITKELGGNIKYLAVYDGHGVRGKEVSLLIRHELRRKLIEDKNKLPRLTSKDHVENYFKEMFKELQRKFDRAIKEYELSGSCAICILIIEKKIYCINLGDSRAVLCYRKDNKLVALEMSIDHKPSRSDEKKRIYARGGEVLVLGDVSSGVMRVFKKNDMAPGLAVSRSLGDTLAHECGVVTDPEVIDKDIEPEDLFIVLASDGVWDAMSSPEVVGFILDKMKNKKENACKMLVEECRNRWELLNIYKQRYFSELYGSMYTSKSRKKNKENVQDYLDIDDISAIVHFFNY